MPSSNIKAVLFDLDGTLVDSAPDLHVAANRIMAEEGRGQIDLPAVTNMIGDGVPKLVERAFEATGGMPDATTYDNAVKRFLNFYADHAADLTRPFPGGVEVLARLKEAGYDLAVCTNKPYDATMEILGALGLDIHLDVVIGGDTIPGVKKPDPRHLQAALDNLGAGQGEAVMVGDNANDVNAARGTGIPVIVARFGYTKGPAENLGADLIIDHFDDLPAAFEQLP
ncbi:MAG: phosphoglycolate phosphatase [Rhodospirillales bacterium]|nr:phosphoglycolate phosphatase [Alphaproteobacteria bacterium]MBL6948630.1 phosphoglycolate phosphatase [Rhodospirillales bacterium]